MMINGHIATEDPTVNYEHPGVRLYTVLSVCQQHLCRLKLLSADDGLMKVFIQILIPVLPVPTLFMFQNVDSEGLPYAAGWRQNNGALCRKNHRQHNSSR